MKIKGQRLGIPTEVVVIPREQGDFVFKCEAVESFEKFDQMCPRPEPPKRKYPNGEVQLVVEDPKYKDKLNKWSEKRVSFMILESLRHTEDLEWEKVKMDDPETWNNYLEEFEEAGLTDGEMNQIVQACLIVNALDDTRIKEAKERFLAGAHREVARDS